MSTRGRPRHPETLTPRQQEVLALLRRGLTNDQIAAELRISVDGAKYHVAEVIRRLGVRDRYEAALVEPGADRRPSHRALAALPFAPKLKLHPAAYAASVITLGAAAAGVILLALGIVRSNGAGAVDAEVAEGLASGRLVAYRVFTGDTVRYEDAERKYRWRIGVYDTEARAPIGSFEAGTPDDPPYRAIIAADRIVLGFNRRLVSYRIDGTGERTVVSWDDGSLLAMGASPDGRTLAVARTTADSPCPPEVICGRSFGDITELLWVDAHTGTVMRRVAPASSIIDGFNMFVDLITWLDDGSGFAFVGSAHSEQPAMYGVIYSDGTVVVSDVRDYSEPSPNGRYVPTYDRGECADLALRRHGIHIKEIATGRILATVSDGYRVFHPHEWSPDSSELLYTTLPYPGGPGDTSCRWTGDGRTWSVLHIDGTVEEDVDPFAVRQRWHDGHAPEFICADGLPTMDYYCYRGGGSAAEPSRLHVAGVTVAEGEGIRVLGRSQSRY